MVRYGRLHCGLLFRPAVRYPSALFFLGASDRKGANADASFLNDHNTASLEQLTHGCQVGKQERDLKSGSALREPSKENNRRSTCLPQGEKGAKVSIG